MRLLAIGLSLFALCWVLFVIDPHTYRTAFLLVSLLLIFLGVPSDPHAVAPTEVPARPPQRTRRIVNVALAVLVLFAFGWPLIDGEPFLYRAATPTSLDLVAGAIAIALVLEATRKTVGWVLPVTALGFLAYAVAGPFLDRIGLSLVAHRGYGLDRLVGSLYMTLDGIFGVPLDVTATYIILFTIYGALLEKSGAGQFFIDWSLAATAPRGRTSLKTGSTSAGPGRMVTLAGFLLGTVSGSGVATTVMLGSVAWPILRRAGYAAETAGAMLSAAGIGALLSPPTLGAAAFLIAELLGITYLQVLIMATLPTLLYYLSVLLMIEAESRRAGTQAVTVAAPPLGQLTRRYGYHFSSLVVVAALMAIGLTAFRAVFWAMIVAFALSFIRRETALTPTRLAGALADGAIGVLPIAATTATAGIIVGVVTLTGLGLKVAGVIVALAGGTRVLTALYAAIAVWLLGLAVPVTASYIIAAVMVAPALVQAGVPDVAAHMFIFYYAVLSEVSPPTALSPMAAAAITGGNAFRTMMLTWKYTLPAFLVPFVFTLSEDGLGLLLRAPLGAIVWTVATAALGVAGLAAGLGGWFLGPARILERALWTVGGLLLFAALPTADLAGLLLLVGGLAIHVGKRGKSARF
ncbi:MAG TPA: TRAP transporter fused permease subunit [Vicinamibacterales bacterium]|nr:TRAP transporter fused permease subunit [Vicinamibacterales bacterium]